jgi:hypothetical protein
MIDFVDGRCFIHLDSGLVSEGDFVSSEVGGIGRSTVGTGVIFMGVRYILTGASSFRIWDGEITRLSFITPFMYSLFDLFTFAAAKRCEQYFFLNSLKRRGVSLSGEVIVKA